MLKIQITQPYGKSPMLRQTPQEKGVWGECQFFINETIEDCDFWFIIDDLPKSESKFSKYPPAFIALEFPSIRPNINESFLCQFSEIISFGRNLNHSCVTETIALFSWHIGIQYVPDGWEKGYKIYDDFINPIYQETKTKLISVISSDKAFTEGHRKRLEFVDILKNHFGESIDVYGRGIRAFPDKWDVIAPYRYNIALENSVCNNGASEKLYDVFLGESFPIYYGCPNILEYFDNRAISIIDIDKPEESISTIENLIASKTYEKSIDYVREAKNLVLNRYNIFAVLSDYCEKRHIKESKRQMKKYDLHPESLFCLRHEEEQKSPFYKIKRWIKGY